ncbi:MAG: hypothetical protein Q8N05_04145 [Bacteroidota bacterium]|nr:hypothetical protein [Bacteroidota bacterium]
MDRTDIKEAIAGSDRDFTSDSMAIVAAETALTLTAWYFFRKG